MLHVLNRSFLALVATICIAATAAAQHPAQALRDSDPTMGALDAEMVVIEYGSFSCSHCAHFQAEAWPVLKSEFIDTGRVRFAFRPMLTNPVQIAGIGVIMAECAADDRYFDAADLLFLEQRNIFEAGQVGGDMRAVYDRIGAAVGVSPDAFMACLNDPAMSELVTAHAEQARADGVRGTPSFFIRGQLLTTAPLDGSVFYVWGGEPLLIDGERVPGQLDGDSFRRIILHFLDLPESRR
jgi:protein-disulfide isomerase